MAANTSTDCVLGIEGAEGTGEAPASDVEDARYEQALEIRDKIRFGDRNAAALQLVDEVLEQFGGDKEELDRRWKELLTQERDHNTALKLANLQQQQALLATEGVNV